MNATEAYLLLRRPDYGGTPNRQPYLYWQLWQVYPDGGRWLVMTVEGTRSEELAVALADQIALDYREVIKQEWQQ